MFEFVPPSAMPTLSPTWLAFTSTNAAWEDRAAPNLFIRDFENWKANPPIRGDCGKHVVAWQAILNLTEINRVMALDNQFFLPEAFRLLIHETGHKLISDKNNGAGDMVHPEEPMLAEDGKTDYSESEFDSRCGVYKDTVHFKGKWVIDFLVVGKSRLVPQDPLPPKRKWWLAYEWLDDLAGYGYCLDGDWKIEPLESNGHPVYHKINDIQHEVFRLVFLCKAPDYQGPSMPGKLLNTVFLKLVHRDTMGMWAVLDPCGYPNFVSENVDEFQLTRRPGLATDVED
jgi:hypothetical protein